MFYTNSRSVGNSKEDGTGRRALAMLEIFYREQGYLKQIWENINILIAEGTKKSFFVSWNCFVF